MTASVTSVGTRANGNAERSSAPAHANDALDLDALLAMGHRELSDLYAAAEVPSIEELSGDLRGRMLVGPWASKPVADAMRRFSRQPYFPWRGKSFSAKSPDKGEGINRVFRDRTRWFRFETEVGKSRAGDFDAVQLDYDLPENPFFIRAIKDEVRRVRPGLFLGQAWLKTGDKTHLALWFALEKR